MSEVATLKHSNQAPLFQVHSVRNAVLLHHGVHRHAPVAASRLLTRAIADQLMSRKADSRDMRFSPPVLLRAAAIFGPACMYTHVFCGLSRCLSSTVRPNADTRVVVNAKSMSVGGRQSNLPLNLRTMGRVHFDCCSPCSSAHRLP